MAAGKRSQGGKEKTRRGWTSSKQRREGCEEAGSRGAEDWRERGSRTCAIFLKRVLSAVIWREWNGLIPTANLTKLIIKFYWKSWLRDRTCTIIG